MKKKYYTKRLLIDIGTEIHQEIKVRAAFRNVTMRTWVLQAILKKIEEEKKYE